MIVYGVASHGRASSESSMNILMEEWAPYNYSEDGQLKGMSVDVVRALAGKLGADIDIRLLPSMRARLTLQSQPRTMMITMLRTPEREHQYKWIGPLGDSAIHFYKRKGDPTPIQSLEDAKRVRSICARQGGLVPDRLKAAGFSNLDAVASDGRAVYRMLIFGRCELAVSDSPLGVTYLLRQMNYPTDAIVQTPVTIVTSPLYIACSKDIPDAEIARWQQALDELKRSGEFQALLKKYER